MDRRSVLKAALAAPVAALPLVEMRGAYSGKVFTEFVEVPDGTVVRDSRFIGGVTFGDGCDVAQCYIRTDGEITRGGDVNLRDSFVEYTPPSRREVAIYT